MGQTDDYSQTQIPAVFVEPAQPPPERRSEGGIGRGHLAVVSLVLFGALVASTAGLLMIRSAEQTEWARTQRQLETDRVTALDRAGRLDVANAQLSADVEKANAKVEKYGAIEYQLNLINEKTQQVGDLRRAKPSYPHHLYMNVKAVPEWTAPGEKLLKDFVAKLDVERSKLITFKEPRPVAGPTTPQITPATRQPASEQH